MSFEATLASRTVLGVGILQVELDIPWARSLKDKRSVVKSIRDKTRRNFNVSIAEVEDQDTITSIVIGVAMAGSDVPITVASMFSMNSADATTSGISQIGPAGGACIAACVGEASDMLCHDIGAWRGSVSRLL